jgi:hypothetical protein
MRHRGRKYIIGAASAVGLLALAIAPGAGAASSTTPTLSPNLVKCTGNLAVQLTPADMGLPPANGKETGTVHCKKGLGKGHQVNTFKTNMTSGDVTGTFVIKFKKGTEKGTFTLVPQEGTLGGGGLYSPATFGATGYAGTLKFKSGTRFFTGVTGTGSFVEGSPDGINYKVVEKIVG